MLVLLKNQREILGFHVGSSTKPTRNVRFCKLQNQHTFHFGSLLEPTRKGFSRIGSLLEPTQKGFSRIGSLLEPTRKGFSRIGSFKEPTQKILLVSVILNNRREKFF